ncbi:MAG: HAMP domain-containing sensor histidine kinase [Patescibacteria group bacterium]|nr:HAMP domain-containing sensor histidine kinase [Patescibacteria group bacterium]
MGFIKSLKQDSKEFGIAIWKLPDFIFVAMGLANIVVMVTTYFWASGSVNDPREAVLLVAAESVVILIISNVFVESAKRIIEINKLKKEFVQIISHQIRSPLTVMKWQIEILQQSCEKNFTEKQRGYVNRIFEENERVMEMINDILNMARVEKQSEDMAVSEVVIEDSIKECIHMLSSFAKFKKIQINFQNGNKSHIIAADSEKLKIAVVNLLENAISYSLRNSQVIISVKESGNKAEIMIKDSGIGINKKEQELIFHKFYRGEGGKKAQPKGTGLGLFMVKKVVEQMNGKIRCKSKINKGTEFYIIFPLARII